MCMRFTNVILKFPESEKPLNNKSARIDPDPKSTTPDNSKKLISNK
jgi:hypothetical protein